MKYDTLIETAAAIMKAGRVPFLWGPPGTGKSAMAPLIREALGVEGTIVSHPVLMGPEDVAGIPVVNRDRGVSEWYPPAEWPLNGRDWYPETGLHLIDEFAQAGTPTQNALAPYILEGRIGQQFKKPGWKVMVMSNRLRDRAGTNRLPGHIPNRVVHLLIGEGTVEQGSPILKPNENTDVQVDHEAWVRWAINNKISVEFIAYIKLKERALHRYDSGLYINPTPRSWHILSDVWNAVPESAQFEVAAGTIGEPAAVELTGFIKNWHKMPDLNQILASPKTAPVPPEPDILYAVIYALSNMADVSNFSAVCSYVDRVPEEFNMLFFRDILSYSPKLSYTEEFRKWATTKGAGMMRSY